MTLLALHVLMTFVSAIILASYSIYALIRKARWEKNPTESGSYGLRLQVMSLNVRFQIKLTLVLLMTTTLHIMIRGYLS